MDPMLIMICLFVVVTVMFFVVLSFRRDGENQKITGLSPVSRQHLEIYQGEELPVWLMEKTKNKINNYLENGMVMRVEGMLRPGLDYVVVVRSLLELGTNQAFEILQKAFGKTHSKDPLEDLWYAIDITNALRQVNRDKILPEIVGYLCQRRELAIAPLFAAEIVSFDSFPELLKSPIPEERNLAVVVLSLAMDGLQSGISLEVFAEAKIGSIYELVWENRIQYNCAALVVLFQNGIRFLRRYHGMNEVLERELQNPEDFRWQIMRLDSLESSLKSYLSNAQTSLVHHLEKSSWAEHRDVLRALYSLKCAPPVSAWEWLADPGYPYKSFVWELFAFEKTNKGQALVTIYKSAFRFKNFSWLYSNPKAKKLEAIALAKCLRHHPGIEAENCLLELANSGDSMVVQEALTSLGWWEPVNRLEVLKILHKMRKDAKLEISSAATAALARLGERKSLQSLARNLLSDDPLTVHQTIHTISTQGISLLWPELDQLADSANADVAIHAREALAHLSEDL